MAFKLKISDVEKRTKPDFRKVVRGILEHMSEVKGQDTYSNYAPSLDFSQKLSRGVVGKACGAIWDYCDEEGIPWLNLLVVSASDSLPGTGMQKWYEELYGTLKGYEEFCTLNIQIAEMMLKNGIIQIEI